MDEHRLWFGTREYMQYIPCPQINGDHSGVGWSTSAQYLNGGAFERNSATSHREFEMSWSLAKRVDLQPLYDYAAGIYGSGPLYFIDPFAADLNVLPEWWASPGMATLDAPVLVGEDRPLAVNNPNQSLGYPTRGVTYAVDPAKPRQTLWLPIPPGKTLWVGAHGAANSGAAVRVTPFTGPGTSGTPVDLVNEPVTSNARVTDSFSSASGYVGAEVSFSGTGNLNLVGLIAQVLDNGFAPQVGGFIGGMGASGCTFRGKPTKLAYSSAMDFIGSSATLVETEGWE